MCAADGRLTDRRTWSLPAVLDCLELNVLAGTRYGERLQQADTGPIELVLVLGLEQRVVLRLQDVPAEGPVRNRSGRGDTEDLSRVLRGSRGIFLAVEVSDFRRRLHDVARLRTVDACCPGTVVRAGRQLRRKLAEVPDIALIVLPVPIQGVFRRDTGVEDLVTDFNRFHAGERWRVVRNGDDVDDRCLLDISRVVEPRSRNQREIRIVDCRRLLEVARIEARAGRRRPRPRAIRA